MHIQKNSITNYRTINTSFQINLSISLVFINKVSFKSNDMALFIVDECW